MTLPHNLVEKSNSEFYNFEIKVITKNCFFIILLFVKKIKA